MDGAHRTPAGRYLSLARNDERYEYLWRRCTAQWYGNLLHGHSVAPAKGLVGSVYGTGAMVSVTSLSLTATHTYTLMVYNLFTNSQCDTGFCPPWVMNIGSPQPGRHTITFTSPLNDSSVEPQNWPVWQFIQNS